MTNPIKELTKISNQIRDSRKEMMKCCVTQLMCIRNLISVSDMTKKEKRTIETALDSIINTLELITDESSDLLQS